MAWKPSAAMSPPSEVRCNIKSVSYAEVKCNIETNTCGGVECHKHHNGEKISNIAVRCSEIVGCSDVAVMWNSQVQ